jgi:uncharacterized protein YjgD (DUF1641 family)
MSQTVKADPGKGMPSELAALQASLASAHDSQMLRLVAMLDAMPDRGLLDDLVAAFRPRMAAQPPLRPLQLGRLLFLPLDPLIVPPARCFPDTPTIPRSALGPMVEVVRAGAPGPCETVKRMIEGQDLNSIDAIADAGAVLWPAAAKALANSSVPARWTERTSLPDAAYAKLSRDVAAVMAQVLKLRNLTYEMRHGGALDLDSLQAMLAQVHKIEKTALGMMMAVLLSGIPEAVPTVQRAASEAAARGDLTMKAALEQAKSTLLDRLEMDGAAEAIVGRERAKDVPAEVDRLGCLLQGLRTDASPAHRGRVDGLLQRLDASCATRFTAGLSADFVRRLASMDAKSETAEFVMLEEAARALVRMAHEARKIGNRETYDGQLRQTAAAVMAMPPDGALSTVDRARLVELLVGSEEAWAMLSSSAAR